jgi:hypothetical protein
MNGFSNLSRARFQFDLYAEGLSGYATNQSVGAALRAAMLEFKDVFLGGTDVLWTTYENEVRGIDEDPEISVTSQDYIVHFIG